MGNRVFLKAIYIGPFKGKSCPMALSCALGGLFGFGCLFSCSFLSFERRFFIGGLLSAAIRFSGGLPLDNFRLFFSVFALFLFSLFYCVSLPFCSFTATLITALEPTEPL